MPRAAALAGLAVLAPALGGSTQLWAQAVLLLGLAVFLIVAPPRRSPEPAWMVLFVAVGALALAAFLPVRWLGIPEWRQKLLSTYSVELPATLSPQPWLSIEAACLLFGGLVFTWLLLAQPWGIEVRRRVLRFYALGIVVLASMALCSHALRHKLPFWPQTLNSPIDFGFFPNRNQTANVLALAGITSTALAFDCFARKRQEGWFWVTAVLVIGVALVIDYSRAGIALFVGGIAVWVLVLFALSNSRKSIALGLAGVALLLTLFFLFGGATFQRFNLKAPDSLTDFRVSVQADAWRLAAAAPWLGQGLGNFEPMFAMARATSAGQNRALHPESDWLWVAVEMGWPAALLLVGAFFLWLKQCLPLSSKSDPGLRAAAVVCGVAFALHSVIDVSGHRPGAVWPALFVAALALHPDRRLPSQRWVASMSRVLGILLAAIGVWWLASTRWDWGNRVAPTSHTLARLTSRLDQENAEGSFPKALLTANEALHISPLDWHLYYERGVAQAATSPLTWVAARDFRTARYLEPQWAVSCFTEGKLWMSIDQPDLALEAWTEALRRAGTDGPGLYAQMLAAAGARFTIHAALEELAQTNRDFQLVFLQYADRLECEVEIGRILDGDPVLQAFSRTQRKMLFAAWYERGDRSMLVSRLLAQPEWLEDGWPWLARSYAEDKEYERAYRTARQFGAVPALPHLHPTKSLTALEEQFRFHPDNIEEGLELYSAQREAGQMNEAIVTLVALQAIHQHPTYITFLEGELRAELGQWEDAWEAWSRFAEGNLP